MGRMTESISAINSAVRTFLALVVVGGFGAGGWYAYNLFQRQRSRGATHGRATAAARGDLERVLVRTATQEQLLQVKEEEITSLNQHVKEQKQEIDRLDTAIRLLKVNHRVARISVLDQTTEPQTSHVAHPVSGTGGPGQTDRRAAAVSDQRRPGLPGQLGGEIRGQIRGEGGHRSLDIAGAVPADFWRVPGATGRFRLDQAGARPEVYGRGGKMSDLEKQIWDDFWTVANDEAQSQLGIRAAHGDAPSIRVRKGSVYRIELRASDGLSIRPEGQVEPPKPPTA